MIPYPTFAIEVAADEAGSFVRRQRKHERRDGPFRASKHSGTQHVLQEAPEGQRVIGQLEVLVRPCDNSGGDTERFLELSRVRLKIALVLVGNAQAITGEAPISDDVSQELVKRHTLSHLQAALLGHVAVYTKARAQPSHHIRSQ